MTRRSVLIFLFICLCRQLAAQSLVDTPLVITSLSMNLAGKVDSITELTLSVKVMEVGATLQVNGDSGTKVITVPDTALTIMEERAWKFDKQNRLASDILRVAGSRPGDLRETEASLIRYKGQRITSVITRKNAEVVDSTSYVYGAGKISRLEHYDAKKKYTGRKQFFQNKDQVLSTISNKNAELELLDMIKLWYTEDGELKEVSYHDQNQRWIRTVKYEFGTDSAGRKHVKMLEFAKPDTCTGMISYLADETGNHVEDVVQDDRGMVSSYTTAIYNDYGHCTAQTVFTGEKIEYTSTYEYDDQKNWVIRRIYRNGEPYRFIRRTILYRE